MEAPTRESLIAWSAGFLAGLLFAIFTTGYWLRWLAPADCPPPFCDDFIYAPGPIVLAIVAAVSGLYGLTVRALVRRRQALRRAGRSPRPPFWAAMTGATLFWLIVASLVGGMGFVPVFPF